MKTLKGAETSGEGSVWLTPPVGGINSCLKEENKKNEKAL